MEDLAPHVGSQGTAKPLRDSAHGRNLGKAMSDHVAMALLVYTGLQIFVTVKALKEGASSILPYFALIVLVAAIIPACRAFERRWAGMMEDDGDYAGEFNRDRAALWLLAIGLPFLLTLLFTAMFGGI